MTTLTQLFFLLVCSCCCFAQTAVMNRVVDSYLREKNFQGSVQEATQAVALEQELFSLISSSWRL